MLSTHGGLLDNKLPEQATEDQRGESLDADGKPSLVREQSEISAQSAGFSPESSQNASAHAATTVRKRGTEQIRREYGQALTARDLFYAMAARVDSGRASLESAPRTEASERQPPSQATGGRPLFDPAADPCLASGGDSSAPIVSQSAAGQGEKAPMARGASGEKAPMARDPRIHVIMGKPQPAQRSQLLAELQRETTEHGAASPALERHQDARIAAIVGMPAPLAASLAAHVGTVDPRAAAQHQTEEERAAEEDAAEEQRLTELALQDAKAQIGTWSRDSAQRLADLEPKTAEDVRDAKKLTPHGWAVCRLAMGGSLSDLAYAVQQMQLGGVPQEVFGVWVVLAMGMRNDGTALRQLYTAKARRLLVRCYALWCCGMNERLRNVAGSPSMRTVRAVKRLPQTLLARVAAIGGQSWHRSTTTRDAAEAHNAGVWRRVRLPKDKAHVSEHCGASGQVVSRYWAELPRLARSRRDDLPSSITSVVARSGVERSAAHEWACQQARNALRYATRAVEILRKAGDFVTITDLMQPLVNESPPA